MEETARPGLRLKSIRIDDERGEFLGQMPRPRTPAAACTSTRAWRPASSSRAALTDYHGHVNLHEMGINYRGSTHDAISYVPTVLVSKLEGPVTYPPEEKLLSGVHAGSTYQSFRNQTPTSRPRSTCRWTACRLSRAAFGLSRQPIYDYAGSGLVRRLLQWKLRPETEMPAWQAGDWVELWIRGGEIAINGQKAFANCFVVIEPGATVRIASPFGALALVWAEGRERWAGAAAGDLFASEPDRVASEFTAR